MKFTGIIPARFKSTRFPGKPLAMIKGKPMIQHVYERSVEAIGNAWVATDSTAIFEAVESFGGKAIMTSEDHRSGTDRCAEASVKIADSVDFDVIINIQGDEPFIQPDQIRKLMQCFTQDVEIATLVRKITSINELKDPNKPKVVIGADGDALYFSRAAIPFARDLDLNNWLSGNDYWAHIGIYAYRKDILQKITRLQPGKLEVTESLEQLRWLENGFRIRVAETEFSSFGIDTPEDLQLALKLFAD
jgi:3-deoxy-manno-octulosonate cytidylyltransferase (CMP-KDO synthetase)